MTQDKIPPIGMVIARVDKDGSFTWFDWLTQQGLRDGHIALMWCARWEPFNNDPWRMVANG